MSREEWAREAREVKALRKRQDAAARKVTVCVHPECDEPLLKAPDSTEVLCADHAFEVWKRWNDLGDSKALSKHQGERRIADSNARRRAAMEAESRSHDPGWIYYLRIGDQIKIGYSVDVKRRMRAYPPEAQLLAVHPGTKALERDMHTQFASSRAAGREWFYPHDDLLAHIAAVVEQFGEPTGFAHRYRTPGAQRLRPRGWSKPLG